MSWNCKKWCNLLCLTFIYVLYILFCLLNSSYLHLFNSRSKQKTIFFNKQIIYFGYGGWKVLILIIFYLICIENCAWLLMLIEIFHIFVYFKQLALIVRDIPCNPPKIHFFKKFKYQSEDHKLCAKCKVEKT